MVDASFQIRWSKRALRHFNDIRDFIAIDSPQNARKVVHDIAVTIGKAAVDPYIFPADKQKINNDGSHRAFEKHSYRVVYRIKGNTVLILRVRHVKREPKTY